MAANNVTVPESCVRSVEGTPTALFLNACAMFHVRISVKESQC